MPAAAVQAVLSPPLVSVLVPVLGRPEAAERLLASLESAREGVPWEIVFLASPDDDGEQDAVREAISYVSPQRAELVVVPFDPGPGDYARKINYGYRHHAHGPHVLLAADDLAFHDGWATQALRVAGETGCGVVGTNDLGNPLVVAGRHSTHPLVARWYVDGCGGSLDGPGVIYHESYNHLFVDTELCELAQSRGCYAHAADSVIEHLHPLWGKAPMDPTYEVGGAGNSADQSLFHQRRLAWAASLEEHRL